MQAKCKRAYEKSPPGGKAFEQALRGERGMPQARRRRKRGRRVPSIQDVTPWRPAAKSDNPWSQALHGCPLPSHLSDSQDLGSVLYVSPDPCPILWRPQASPGPCFPVSRVWAVHPSLGRGLVFSGSLRGGRS